MFNDLKIRSEKSPIIRPNLEKYWSFSLTLSPKDSETLIVLVCYYNKINGRKIEENITKTHKGYAVNLEQLPNDLQQIILTFLNQISL